MKIKVILAAGAIALAGQSANAATDYSCNPFMLGGCGMSAYTTGSSSVANPGLVNLFAALRAGNKRRAARAVRPATGFVGFKSFESFISTLVRPVPSGETDDGAGSEDPIVEVNDPIDGGGEEIAVVPVPAAGFLLLAGLGGLAMVRRKKS